MWYPAPAGDRHELLDGVAGPGPFAEDASAEVDYEVRLAPGASHSVAV